MPLLITPRQLAQQAEFYHQLASMLTAGVSLIKALETLAQHPPSRALRKPIVRALEGLSHNLNLAEALARLGDWLPSFDLALIEAGEQSGRLDASFRLLARFYEERAQLARKVMGDLLYPLFIVHLALVIFPLPLLTGFVWQGRVALFLVQKLTVFGILYGGIFSLIYACQSRHGEYWRFTIETLLHRIPLIGSARRTLALARLSAALEGLLNAGVPVIHAWELAAASSGSVALHRAVGSWRPGLEEGQTPAELIRASNAFPELFSSLYSTGEISGQIDQTLRRLTDHYQEEATRKLRLVAEWAPRLVYVAILLVVACKIVSFWSGYYGDMLQQF